MKQQGFPADAAALRSRIPLVSFGSVLKHVRGFSQVQLVVCEAPWFPVSQACLSLTLKASWLPFCEIAIRSAT